MCNMPKNNIFNRGNVHFQNQTDFEKSINQINNFQSHCYYLEVIMRWHPQSKSLARKASLLGIKA